MSSRSFRILWFQECCSLFSNYYLLEMLTIFTCLFRGNNKDRDWGLCTASKQLSLQIIVWPWTIVWGKSSVFKQNHSRVQPHVPLASTDAWHIQYIGEHVHSERLPIPSRYCSKTWYAELCGWTGSPKSRGRKYTVSLKIVQKEHHEIKI